MNEELKEKINLFVKDYQELCKKHGLQIASYPKLTALMHMGNSPL